MTRITITLDEDQHRSLKLLSILENKTLAQLLQEAIHAHLQAKGADRLEVTQGRSDQQPDGSGSKKMEGQQPLQRSDAGGLGPPNRQCDLDQ
jgi:hypothetical protein